MPKWTDDEIALLRRYYPDTSLSLDEVAVLIGKQRTTVQKHANKLGVYRTQGFESDKLLYNTCLGCGRTYQVDPNHINRPPKYCSTKCTGDDKRNIPDDTVFSRQTPDVAYWAGFMMADGNVRRRLDGVAVIQISLAAKDEIHLMAFADFLGYTLPLQKDGGNVSMVVHSQRMLEDLGRWGVVPRKTYVGSIPDDIPDGLLPHYIRGLIDGDGGVYIIDRSDEPSRIAGERWKISLTNNTNVIRLVASILNDHLNIQPTTGLSYRNPKTGHETWYLSFSQKSQVRETLIWLDYDGDGPALPRKRERALRIIATEPYDRRRSRSARAALAAPMAESSSLSE